MIEDMIRRDHYIDTIRSWLGKPVVKVLSGMRRVGKSTLLELLKPHALGPVLHINMEWIENGPLLDAEALHRRVKEIFRRPDLNQLLLIDEVQEIQGWERAVNSLHAQAWCDILITGSNARVFSGELATLLAGRYVKIPVYPLSLAEFLEFRGLHADIIKRPELDEEFYRWLHWGGLPGLHRIGFAPDGAESDLLRNEYLLGIFETVVLKDVVLRNQVRDPAFLDRLIRYAFDNTGRMFSASSIRDWMKAQKSTVSLETIQNYVRFIVDAQLVYTLPRSDVVGKRLLAYNEKLYISDLGLRHALLGYRADDIGQILENVVLLELLRRRYTVSVGQQGGKEIDFVAERGGERLYLQVAYLLASPETIDREFSALESVQDHFPKIVLSMDASSFASRNGIQHRYLPDWLLRGDAGASAVFPGLQHRQ